MFGTMGITELILILAIVLIVFGAGKLPKIGEGLGKALKGFKKEVREADPLPQAPEQAQAVDAQVVGTAPAAGAAPTAPAQPAVTTAQPAPAGPPPVPPQMGPAATPGTTAYMVAQQSWKPVTPPPVVPPAPATAGNPAAAAAAPAQPSGFKAEVNKPAVQRVMAQQAAMKTKQQVAQQPRDPPPNLDRQAMEAAGMQPPPADPGTKVSIPKALDPQNLQNLGSGIGDALRTFREAANDVKRAIDPSMHQIKAEVEAAQKEIQGSIDYVKEGPKVEEPPK